MKEALLDTAIVHFARDGFEGAGTRAISRDADTAMSSITYHFGGKEGLYLACADHIAGQIRQRIFPVLDRFSGLVAPTQGEAVEGLVLILGGFARIMLDRASESWAGFIAREQQAPTQAFERLWEGVIKRVVDTAVTLILAARPDFSEREARALAITLWGQALVLRVGRASVCRIMDVAEIDPATANVLVERLVANARCILLSQSEKAS